MTLKQGALSSSPIEQRLREWASTRPDILAIYIYGSRSGRAGDAAKGGDLDLVLFTSQGDLYTEDPEWLRETGDIWICAMRETGAGDPEWYVLYAGGAKVDIIITTVEEDVDLSQVFTRSPYRIAFSRGYRPLYLGPKAMNIELDDSSSKIEIVLPGKQTLGHMVDDALMVAVRASLILDGGDLVYCLWMLNSELRQMLVTLIEIHAQTTKDPGADTWYEGRYMDLWADPEIYQFYLDTFGPAEIQAAKRALLASVELILRIASDLSDSQGYRLLGDGQLATANWLREEVLNKIDEM